MIGRQNFENITPETVVKFYSPFARCEEGEFTFLAIKGNAIRIRLRSGKERPIPISSWDEIAPRWKECKSGELTRSAFSKKNFNTTYVFSLLHHLDLINAR